MSATETWASASLRRASSRSRAMNIGETRGTACKTILGGPPRRDTTAVRGIPQAPRATGFGLVGATWGSNFNGQLGGTDFIPGTGVVQVSGISKATAIAAGEEFSLAGF